MKTEIQNLIADMTLEEKVSLCSGRDFWHLKGISRLGIPVIKVADGPHGLRVQEGDPAAVDLDTSLPATCFPTASALAATWNRELIHEVGEALAQEAREQGVSVILGPGANIKRSPLCGRNFEYFSEDPYLSGKMAKSHIAGVQSQGIGTSLKHFAANNQEYRRMTIDAVVDERALREIYLAGFEIAVRESQPWTVMGAYNRVNGSYACEHPGLLQEILKDEWGHQGLTLTDWGAMNNRAAALQAGLEIEMPGPSPDNDASIAEAVRTGVLAESVLDQALERILDLIFRSKENQTGNQGCNWDAHHALARKTAGEGMVLLKNQTGALPIQNGERVALIGRMAKYPRFQGAGSSLVNPARVDCIYDEMVSIAGSELLSYAPGYSEEGNEIDPPLLEEALGLVENSDVVVICAGLPERYEVEGLDREDMRLPQSHNRLIEALAQEHSRVVVVLSNGSPVEMPWVNQVEAVLEAYLGGQAGAGAAAEILYGQINPSGKLAETFPVKLEDTPAYHYFPGGPNTVEYRESIYVGYRFFDSVAKDVLFPFGHGLSYTTFEYSDLRLSATSISCDEPLTVRINIKNSGSRTGKEIVQLYVSPVEPTAFRPKKELKGFGKVDLEPGEEQELLFELNSRAFAYFSTSENDWQVEDGEYQILVGASSRDIREYGVVNVSSNHGKEAVGERDQLPAYRDFPPDAVVPREEFESLLGRPLPDNRGDRKTRYTLNTPVSDMDESILGRLLIWYLNRNVQEMLKDDPESPNAVMIRSIVKQLPLRGLSMMGGQSVSRSILEGMLTMLNGRFLKGLLDVLRAGKK